MKLTFRLKGGPGSGFHGHSGIPGHQGGSLSNGSHPHVKFLDSPLDVKLNYENRYAYFITANDEIVDMEGTTHNGYLMEKSQYANELAKTFGIWDINRSGANLTDQALANGTLRIVWPKNRNEVDVHMDKIDVNSMRRVKNLIKSGKLPVASAYYIDGKVEPHPNVSGGRVLNYSLTIPYEKLMRTVITSETLAKLLEG
jgi:hypothetical protein